MQGDPKIDSEPCFDKHGELTVDREAPIDEAATHCTLDHVERDAKGIPKHGQKFDSEELISATFQPPFRARTDTMGLWAKSVVIFNAIREHGKQSIRSLADRTGLSKSSVHRHLQAIDRRDRYPESSLWETQAGRTWLIRLIVATLFVFGLKRGVGAETLSEFFGRLRLEAHVGCSPSALRTVMHPLERLLLETAAAWEQEGMAHGEIRPIIGAVDETFLPRMMLVFMGLARGYLLMEAVAVDRTYDTWYGGGINRRLKRVWRRGVIPGD